MTSYQFSRWQPWTRNTTSGFVFDDATLFRRSKSTRKLNFVDLSQSTSEIHLLPVWKYKRPPYWNSSTLCDFDPITVICVLFCIKLPNFMQISSTSREDMTSYRFSRWQPRRRTTTSCFVSNDITLFQKPKSICKPNSSIYQNFQLLSVLEKQMSAILEFFSRLPFRPYRSDRHVILHQNAKFHPNGSTWAAI